MVTAKKFVRGRSQTAAMQKMRYFFSHHRKVTAVALFHHMFSPVKTSVLLFRNCNYMILFGSARDKISIRTLGGQVKPDNPKFLLSAYESATKSKIYAPYIPLSKPKVFLRSASRVHMLRFHTRLSRKI